MSSIDCNFTEFKQMAREFHVALPSMDLESLDNAWKCLGLAYLGMNEPMWQESAAIVLKMEARAKLHREVQLERDEAAVH